MVVCSAPAPPFCYEDRRGGGPNVLVTDALQLEFLHDVRAVAFRILTTSRSMSLMSRANPRRDVWSLLTETFLFTTIISSEDIGGDSDIRNFAGDHIRLDHNLTEIGVLAHSTKYANFGGSAYRRSVFCCAVMLGYECQYWARIRLWNDRAAWENESAALDWEEKMFGGRVVGLEGPRDQCWFRGQLKSVCAVQSRGDRYFLIPDGVIDAVVQAQPGWQNVIRVLPPVRKIVDDFILGNLNRRSVEHRSDHCRPNERPPLIKPTFLMRDHCGRGGGMRVPPECDVSRWCERQ